MERRPNGTLAVLFPGPPRRREEKMNEKLPRYFLLPCHSFPRRLSFIHSSGFCFSLFPAYPSQRVFVRSSFFFIFSCMLTSSVTRRLPLELRISTSISLPFFLLHAPDDCVPRDRQLTLMVPPSFFFFVFPLFLSSLCTTIGRLYCLTRFTVGFLLYHVV